MIQQVELLSVQEVISSLKGLCNLLCITTVIIYARRNRFQMHLPEKRQNIILQVRSTKICRAAEDSFVSDL